jgi:hypothetical protein
MVPAMLISLMTAAAAGRSTHDVVYAAIIAASAAIIGGIIGGSIPGFFMLKAEDKRHAHMRVMANQARDEERQREHRAVIGTARALYEFYERVNSIFEVALETAKWWPDELDATIQPPSLDDQKAVLGQLTSEEAGVVASTTRVIELVRTRRGLEMEYEPVGPSGLPPLTEVATAQLETGRTAAQDAARFLRRVADLPTPPAATEA